MLTTHDGPYQHVCTTPKVCTVRIISLGHHDKRANTPQFPGSRASYLSSKAPSQHFLAEVSEQNVVGFLIFCCTSGMAWIRITPISNSSCCAEKDWISHLSSIHPTPSMATTLVYHTLVPEPQCPPFPPQVPERYADRNGGYTRIVRTMPRRGDCAKMCFIELI